jgi:hypothetical protein
MKCNGNPTKCIPENTKCEAMFQRENFIFSEQLPDTNVLLALEDWLGKPVS